MSTVTADVDILLVEDNPGDLELAKHLPVVVLTSSEQESDLIESYKLGTTSYLVKPVDFGDFTQAVTKLGMYWLLLNRSPPADTP